MIKVRVYHSYYGCDTGCCGHIFEFDDKEKGDFSFDHPYYYDGLDAKAWARKVIEDTWPECVPLIDWDTLDVTEVNDGTAC